ncbi:HAMP domain-containing histidine kinase [Methylobacterium sp. J-026]|nr:HAMP domain-containing histidine kinase [Methylobacterium sp. J-026]
MRSTLFTRLAVATVTLFVLAIGVATLFLYDRFETLNGQFREGTLRSFAYTLAREVTADPENGRDGHTGTVAHQVIDDGGVYVLLTQQGQLLAAAPGIAAPLVVPQGPQEQFFMLPRPGQAPLYGLSSTVRTTQPPLILQIAFPNGPLVFDTVLEEFVQDIAWIWIPFLAGTVAVNLLVTRLALRPLRRAAQEAELIEPGNVGTRLSEGAMPDEVLILVRAVNQSLARLQQGYLVLEQFVGDVAHELRTPLAIMKTRMAMAGGTIARPITEDLCRMERLVEQLLDRVRLGGLHVEADDVVDLSMVAREVTAMLGPAAIARGLSMELLGAERPVPVAGLRDYLARALRNLIENALMHAPPGTTITVTVEAAGALSVRDRGGGFGPDLLAPGAVQGREFRSGREDGIGLGLSIVERTMTAHGGRLALRNAPDGGAVAIMDFAQEARAEPSLLLAGNRALK